jgi:hypothetical protein
VGVFISTVAFVISCSEEGDIGGPTGTPNPNDPHPVWVFFFNTWAKYDQNGHELLTVKQDSYIVFTGLNPETGEIWAYTELGPK